MTILKALWIGGPPGKTIENITKNLAKDGIEVVDRWDSVVDTMKSKHRIPDWVDVVLFNYQFCSHSLQDKIKKMCKQAHKPFILASNSASKTVFEVRAKGLMPSRSIESDVIEQITHPDILKLLSELIDEKEILLVQQKGILRRLQEIDAELRQIKHKIS